MMNDDFAVFIITHKRPNNQLTLNTLINGNYTGKIFFILDDEDDTIDEYIKKFGKDRVKIFHKTEWFDIGDNLKTHKGVPEYARNECFRIAKELNLKYFVQLDDDYTQIRFRYEENGVLKSKKIDDFDKVFSAMCDFLELQKVYCVAFAVDGDFIGGIDGKFRERIYRNARNSFFCKTDCKFEFLGRINEDVTTPAYNNMLGRLFFTILDVTVTLYDHEKNKGGSSEQYKEVNLYWNYFYPILWCPSAIKIGMNRNKLIKKIQWNNLTPMIINERYKKL